jgi:hypothetical protein
VTPSPYQSEAPYKSYYVHLSQRKADGTTGEVTHKVYDYDDGSPMYWEIGRALREITEKTVAAKRPKKKRSSGSQTKSSEFDFGGPLRNTSYTARQWHLGSEWEVEKDPIFSGTGGAQGAEDCRTGKDRYGHSPESTQSNKRQQNCA